MRLSRKPDETVPVQTLAHRAGAQQGLGAAATRGHERRMSTCLPIDFDKPNSTATYQRFAVESCPGSVTIHRPREDSGIGSE